MAAYGVLPMILNFLPPEALGGFDAATLPMPATIQKHLFGSVSVIRAVPEGTLIDGYSPVGIPITGMGTPLALGALLPALGRARGEARATQCRSNLRQIGLAITMYASDNRGRSPEKLTDLLEEGYLTQTGAGVLMCPNHKGEAAQPGDDYVLREAFADGSLKLSSGVGEPIVWDDPSKMWHKDRINVLFTDGSVKTLMTAGLLEPPSLDSREWPALVEVLRNLYPDSEPYGPSVEPRAGRSLVGKPLPDLADLGVTADSENLAGKRILLCFWNMEERPSRHCLQELAAKAGELEKKNVVVLAVHAGDIDPDALENQARSVGIPFPVYALKGDRQALMRTWGVQSMPCLILTDDEHVVRAEGFGIDELDAKLAELAKP